MLVGIAYHKRYRQYDFGPGHPFRGDRFDNAMKLFESQGLLNLPSVNIVEPQIATRNDLLRVHSEEYIDSIFNLAEKRRPYDLDTPVSPDIIEGALYIVGGALRIGESLFNGEIQRGVSLGGGLHHAGVDFGGGFCIFNDVAILASYLQKEKSVKRVLILDYDVHAGNGTSNVFYSDPTVLFISVHQDPRTLFPGTGFTNQIGQGEGEGFNINLPLPPGTGNETYLLGLREIFSPLAKEFKPDVILANGGSDPHFADILGSLSLTVKGFFSLSQLIARKADETCSGKAIMLVGSGYNPAVLPSCWYALAAGIADVKSIKVVDPYEPPSEPAWCRNRVKATIQELKRVLSKYWTCFR